MRELYPYQLSTAEKCAQVGRHIINFEMGLGKTATTILAMQRSGIQNALIVCPASVRATWKEELDTWWPDHPEVGLITEGRGKKGSKKKVTERALAYMCPIKVVSYGLLQEFAYDESTFDAIIFDEAHRLKNPEAKWSKIAKLVMKRCHKDTLVLALTGTLMPNEPKDVHNILDTLWPGQWGNKWYFYNRYCNKEVIVNEKTGEKYGTHFWGVNSQHSAELTTRLARVSTRVTKRDVSHLLPPFTVQLRRVAGPVRRTVETFADYTALQETLNSYSEYKTEAVKEFIEDAIAQGETHICVITHLKNTARGLHTLIQSGGHTAYCVTGDLTPEQRTEIINAASKEPKAVIVATMHSIEEGINGLANFTSAVFAELWYQPKVMVQTAARFNRLSSKQLSTIVLLCCTGTSDELIAERVRDKLQSIASLIKAGGQEGQLQEALGSSEVSDEEFLKIINQPKEYEESFL